MTINTLVQGVVNGLLLGSLYGLLAIGYSVVYGILQFINFAHGNVFMSSAYVAIVLVNVMLLPWPVGFLGTLAIVATIGVLVDRVAYMPLRSRGASSISNLVSAIGVSFLLENLVLLLFRGAPKPFPSPSMFRQTYEIGGIYLPSVALYSLAATGLSLLVLHYFVYRTEGGLSMRAVSEDLEVASLMGVQINQVIATAFAIGSALAAVAAIIWGLRFPLVWPTMALVPSTKAFVAAVVGGVGNLAGAVAGGVLLGFVEVMFVVLFPSFSAYRDVFSFLLLVLVLLFRPRGLLGAVVHEEKL